MDEHSPKITGKHPHPWWLGLDNILRIRKDQLGFFQQLHAHYGDVVPLQLGPYRSICLFHPAHIDTLLTRHSGSLIRFQPVIRRLAKWNGNSVIMAEGAAWQQKRRTIMHGFQRKRLEGYAQQVVQLATALRKEWERRSDGNEVLVEDLDHEMAVLALRIIVKTMFSAELGDEANDMVRNVSVLSHTAFRESTAIIPVPDWPVTPSKRRKLEAIGFMKLSVHKLVQQRLSGEPQDDMLSLLLAEYGDDIAGVEDEVMSLLIAGHETSGAAMTWVWHLLSIHPEIRGKLQEEIATHIGEREPVLADLPKLELLTATIKEVLRLYPPAYTLFLRQAVEDIDLQDFVIKRGQLVHIMPYVLHRDKRWFAEPEQFNPQRFMEGDLPKAYLPFGNGARICVGQSFAMMELVLITTVLLQNLSPIAIVQNVTLNALSSLRPADILQMRFSGYEQKR